MATTGKVIVWKGAYGFVETEDGRTVYIHVDEIEGGRLRVARTVQFDIEEVEGQDGKLKGINVSGEAVLKKGEKLSDDLVEEDKKLRENFRDAAKEKNKSLYDPVWDKVSKMSKVNKVQLVKDLLTELDMGVLETGPDAGKRADPTERGSKQYTKKEFLAFYGPQKGEKMWELAGRFTKGGKGGKGRR
eukprot:TRINITY_DN51279_c0_g1_i1.p2 TRINITY_DN51279_c0_g1~~TRINITY_DN51279_c0_g1_i1.p2  ORF type:complete len:188 (+),score=97.39 TRINITY_DN51279_c0_g1_i1:55-618(+)